MTHPLTAESALAAALLDPARPLPPGLRAWNLSNPARRFAVHRNNVLAALVDALAANFPVVQQLVGVEFFRAMAGVFVRRHPPAPGALAHYGSRDDSWPAFIKDFEPARSVPYLASVACLEGAWLQSLHAADAQPLGLAECEALQDRGFDVDTLRLACHPSLRLVCLEHAAVSVWAEHQTDADVQLAHVDTDRPEAALLVRPGLAVQVLPVPLGQWVGLHALLSAFHAGVSLSAAAARARELDATFDLGSWLGQLLRAGALVASPTTAHDGPAASAASTGS